MTGRTADETTFDELATEARDQSAADLDLQSTIELVRRMNAEDAGVPAAVARAESAIAAAVDAIAERLAAGGRLVYVGAGTSGRLALVDAAECESTFAVPPGRVVALIAGGPEAAATAQEEAEDDPLEGAAAVRDLGVGPADAVVALSASGRTPYVLRALEEARDAGATILALYEKPLRVEQKNNIKIAYVESPTVSSTLPIALPSLPTTSHPCSIRYQETGSAIRRPGRRRTRPGPAWRPAWSRRASARRGSGR